MSRISPDAAILRHLAARTTCAAAEVGTTLRMPPAEVRARLVVRVRGVRVWEAVA